MNKFFCFLVVYVSFLTSCVDKNELLITSPKLKSIDFIAQYNSSIVNKLGVDYQGDRIVRVDNSTFSYLSNGKVDKEVERIVESNNPEFVSGAKEFELVYQYIYNSKGQLVEIKLLTTYDRLSFPLVRNYQPNRKFTYVDNRLTEIESIPISGSSNTIYKYHYNDDLLDSVTVTTSRDNSAAALTPLENYDYWNSGNNQYPTPSGNSSTVKTIERITYSVQSTKGTNLVQKVFNSLGFIPYCFDVFPFDISHLNMRIDRIEKLNPSLNDEIFGYLWDYKYEIDESGLLKKIDDHIHFIYE